MPQKIEFKPFRAMGRGFTDGFLGVEDWDKAIAAEFELPGWGCVVIAEPTGVEIHMFDDGTGEQRSYSRGEQQ